MLAMSDLPDSAKPKELLVAIEQLSHSYDQTPVLSGLQTGIYSGEVVAMLGANGAGKTTLIQLMLGLLACQQGNIRLLGSSPQQLRCQPALSGQIGVMLQQASLPAQLTVLEQLQLCRAYYPDPLPLDTLIRRFDLQPVLRLRCASLSGGQRQSLLLALAMLGKPRLLFLDEPTTGLDAQSRQRFWQLIRDARNDGLGIVLTTHYLEEADALADRILLLKDGRFIADTSPAALKESQPERQIRCHSALESTVLQQLPGVVRVSPLAPQQWQLDCLDVENCLRRLLTLDPQLSGLTVTAASLEQAFLELTHPTQEITA